MGRCPYWTLLCKGQTPRYFWPEEVGGVLCRAGDFIHVAHFAACFGVGFAVKMQSDGGVF